MLNAVFAMDVSELTSTLRVLRLVRPANAPVAMYVM